MSKPAELQGSNGGYSWEDQIQRPWEVLDMSLQGANKRRRINNLSKPSDNMAIQRGIIRNMVLVIDLSVGMSERDMRPNRVLKVMSICKEFIGDFFDQNPISQLAIIGLRNGLANVMSRLSGDVQAHLDSIDKMTQIEPEGEMSLQNGLELSMGLLLSTGDSAFKEVGIICGSLTSIDPSNLHKTIMQFTKMGGCIRIVGLTARVAICDEMCSMTGGDYSVAIDEHNLQELVLSWIRPLAVPLDQSKASLVQMGFPTKSSKMVLCGCHSELREGYQCPRCGVSVCSVPLACPCCGLTLALSTHLARGFHHLFPMAQHVELEMDKASDCFVCGQSGSLLSCNDCHGVFCDDCSQFVHDTLHNCPKCQSIPQLQVT